MDIPFLRLLFYGGRKDKEVDLTDVGYNLDFFQRGTTYLCNYKNFLEPVWWCSKLILLLQHWHPIWVLPRFLVVPLLIWLSAFGLGKQ